MTDFESFFCLRVLVSLNFEMRLCPKLLALRRETMKVAMQRIKVMATNMVSEFLEFLYLTSS